MYTGLGYLRILFRPPAGLSGLIPSAVSKDLRLLFPNFLVPYILAHKPAVERGGTRGITPLPLYHYASQLTQVRMFKGQCHEIFTSGFFHESVSTQPQSKKKFSAGINDTGGKFATGINDTGGKFCHQFR
jgi:hypothetical protein